MFDVPPTRKAAHCCACWSSTSARSASWDGIRHYLAKHSYGNTETSDLWDALEATSSEPVRRIMDSWIWQEGYPLVSASLSADGTVLLQATPVPFGTGCGRTGRPCRRRGGPSRSRCQVARRCRRRRDVGAQEVKVLLDGDEATVPLLDADAVVVVNSGAHGFYLGVVRRPCGREWRAPQRDFDGRALQPRR